jgi:hypothetical protein
MRETLCTEFASTGRDAEECVGGKRVETEKADQVFLILFLILVAIDVLLLEPTSEETVGLES